MYLRLNVDFFFCVQVVPPPHSFCTSWKSVCRLEVDQSLFVASQTPSIRDFLTPKLNKIPCLLVILTFQKITALGSRNKHLHTAMRTCEEAVFIITRFENRIDCLDIQFQWKFFFNTSLLIGH